MARLLNAIIAQGGATAMAGPVSALTLQEMMTEDPDRTAWHVALDKAETVTGFQWIAPHPALPAEACDIATFVALGRTGHGIGSALFAETAKAARGLRYRWINAAIRADNSGAQTYYQSRGFRLYGETPPVHLVDGTRVSRILMRHDL
jgi:L-amino acid N-acyltransferase YncA